MKRRVVITGLGAVTPIGNTVEEFWNGVRKGACGIGPITKFDTAEYKVHLAGEVKGFVAKERMDFKAARRMGTFSQYAVAAAKEAFADAGISMENEDPFRVGVLVGSGVGDLNACEQAKAKIDAGNQSRVNPFTVPVMIANMAAGNVAIALGAKGKCNQRGNGVCHRNALHWRCLPRNSVQRRGHLCGRWCGECNYAGRRGRLFGTDRTFRVGRSAAGFDSI